MHAGVFVMASQRKKLEKIFWYISRGPVATERLFELHWGNIGYRLKKTWADGTTHVSFTKQELIETGYLNKRGALTNKGKNLIGV